MAIVESGTGVNVGVPERLRPSLHMGWQSSGSTADE